MRKAKDIYSESALVKQSATILSVSADSKAGKGVGKLWSGEKVMFPECTEWRRL